MAKKLVILNKKTCPVVSFALLLGLYLKTGKKSIIKLKDYFLQFLIPFIKSFILRAPR